MSTNKATGQIGEDSAARYVRQFCKMKILGRNVNLKTGEIDIVAQDNKTIVFVEVKAADATVPDDLRPEHHFDHHKQQKLKIVASEYLISNKYPENTDWRVDLATVLVDYESRRATVRYFKNVVAE